MFLHECRQLEIIPTHTLNATQSLEQLFTTTTAKKDLQKIKTNLHKKLLNIEIKETHINITITKGKIGEIERKLSNTLNEIELTEYKKGQWEKFQNMKIKLKLKHSAKMRKLRNEKFKKLDLNFNENWFINYTNINFEMESKWLLSLGNKFALPVNQQNFKTIPLIADMEQWIQDIQDDTRKDITRSRIANKISLFRRNMRNTERERFILAVYEMTVKKIKEQKGEIIITTADKGNKTVILYKDEYMRKMENLLEDRTTYKLTKTDPTEKLQRLNNTILNQLQKENNINRYEKIKMISHAATAPHLYGLPKIHKENLPLRPISSSLNVPCYNLAKYIGKIIKNLISPDYNVKNSLDLREKLKNLILDENDILVSFDVISLFTNIPVHLAINNIIQKWDTLATHTTISKQNFLKILKFCLTDNNYFKFNDKIYTQTYGMPMGSPLSPTIADIVLDTLLDRVIEDLREMNVEIKFISKYVDDLFAVIKKTDEEIILKTLNNYHNKLKFTIEKEINNELPYLDMMIIKRGNDLKTNWYAKSTSSGRIINYYSTQPMKTKLNTATNLIEKILKISDEEYRNNNLEKIRNILRINDYPINIINKLINKTITNYNENKYREKEADQEEKIFYSVSYVPKLTDTKTIKHMIPDNDKVKITHRPNTTLRHLFKTNLTKLDKLKVNNVVYEVQCNGSEREKCNMVYVGTTKRMLATRIAEHQSDVNKGKITTALSQHAKESGHRINFKEVKILDKEKKEKKRYTLESLRIQQRIDKTMNTKEDVDSTKLHYSAAIIV